MAEHPYPSNYRPGTHWATDEAWAILDALPVGALPDDLRFLTAGLITGTLIRIARDGAPPAPSPKAVHK
jgi:hypothetical protein